MKELEDLGLVERIEDLVTGAVDYIRTQMAIDLEPASNALAMWAQCHIEAKIALSDTSVSPLMWKMDKINLVDELLKRRVVIQFRFRDDVDYNTYWALIQPGTEVEICTAIPGYDVDLFIETSATSLSATILARTTVVRELDAGRLYLSGDALLRKTMHRWLDVTDYVPKGGPAVLNLNKGKEDQLVIGAA